MYYCYDVGTLTYFRVVQFDTTGNIFHFYLYAGAFSGQSIVEVTGASYGFIANHTFTWVGQYGVSIPDTINYITAVKSIIFSSFNPPTLSQIPGMSSLFTSALGVYSFNQNAIAQSVSNSIQGGSSNILRILSTSSGTEVYTVTASGQSYPIDSSSTISV